MSTAQKRPKKGDENPDGKHFKPNDVAEAALKYDGKDSNDMTAIDSQLLGKQGDQQPQPQQVDQMYQRYKQAEPSHQDKVVEDTAGSYEAATHAEKIPAGSDEWHRQRRLTHKEVERRRRDAINTGIRQLAELLPRQDSNKSQVLKNAVEYIKQLKENENVNIEKWTLEKLITDQAVGELASSNEKLKQELEKAYMENESLKRELEKLRNNA